jgi:chemotaxis protein histidine kinase CheA
MDSVEVTFVAEARELLAGFSADLHVLLKRPSDEGASQRRFRAPHTIASMAGMLGAVALAEFAGLVERAARRLADAKTPPSRQMLETLDDAAVVLLTLVNRLGEGDLRLQAADLVAFDLRSVFALEERPRAARTPA